MIVYEYPLNEHVRTYLRLECLFGRLQELSAQSTALSHHFSILTLFDIVEACNRADLKSDVLKDLERQKQQIAAFRGNPAVSEAALESTLDTLRQAYQTLVGQHEKPGERIVKDEWLGAIRSRTAIPGGTCAFDLPTYHAWLHGPAEARQADLRRWSRPLEPLLQSVVLLLRLLRDNAHHETAHTAKGQFQMPLPRQREVQLVRVQLDADRGLVPEISGNRFLLAIRLLRRTDNDTFEPADANVALMLALCL